MTPCRSIYSDGLKIEQEPTSESFNTDSERVTYKLATALPVGSKAELRIGFSGKLTGSMSGYYKSSYEVEGKQKFYALTQFEASLLHLTLDLPLTFSSREAYCSPSRIPLLG